MRTQNGFRFVLAALTFTSFVGSAFAADYEIDKSHTKVTYEVAHMMISTVTGEFRDFEGHFQFNEATPDTSKVEFTVKTASLDTNEKKRDDHLRSADFLDVKKFPTMTFTSTKVKKDGGQKYTVLGNLTIHGVKKEVPFEVEYLGTAKDPWGNTRAAFKATADIDRKDFGLNWNKTLDNGGVLVGDKVAIKLAVEAVEKQTPMKKAKK